ncbi:MAG: glycosyltransferase [Bacteroidota bacterium]|jgi:glycosyltransferase involved in cell wall biosynthesis|nr:glycosyltransferase [Bacteroidota bacterium]MCA6442034.1 glycosyltransferase [Bacteroidota bacterium]
MNKISIIIPFLNEADNVEGLVSALNQYFASKQNYHTEVILVNDGSTDDSVQKFSKATFTNIDAKLISLSKNFGSHAALRAGILNATGDFICFMYADLQDPLELIDRLYENLTKLNDIVWATREATNNGLVEKSFSSMYAYLMKKYAVKSFPDKGFDIVMFNKKVQQQLNNNIEANSSIFLQILTLGYKQTSIYYQKQERKKGKSKWTLSKKIKLFIDSFVAFSYAPIRFVTVVGILLFIIGFLFSAYLIIRRLVANDLASGWPLLGSLICLGFGITNISLGIIAEYLWRTLDASRKRPVFVIDQIIDLKNNAK